MAMQANGSSGGSGGDASSGGGPDRVLVGRLEQASKIVDERLARDDRVSERMVLESLLQGNASSEYVLPPNPTWAPLVKKRTLQFPEALMQDFDFGATHSYLGAFPEIERTYITLDNRLYLWDFVDGTDFASFDQLEEIIIAVALAKPKPGVFVADVQHLLVIATPLEVVLVGLSAKPPASGRGPLEISLYLTNLSAPTDGVVVTQIVSHGPSGRIFLSGATGSSAATVEQGGDLYELEYQSQEGWFKSKCRLVNHTRGGPGLGSLVPTWMSGVGGAGILKMAVDDSRNLLYVLTKSGGIRMFHLGADGKAAPTHAASVEHVLRDAQTMCPGAGPLLESRTFRVAGLSVIDKSEGGSIGLVATTQTGVRLYFSLARRGYGYYGSYSSSATTPGSLWICHVRLPPRPPQQQGQPPSTSSTQVGFSQPGPSSGTVGNTQVAFSDVHSVHYSSPGGFFLASNTLGSQSDDEVILTTAPDVGRAALGIAMNQQPSIVEVAGTIQLEGSTAGLAEIRVSGSSVAAGGMELAAQLAVPPRQWIVVTNMGVHVLARQRPIDTLAGLLENVAGREHELAQFWDNYGRDQSCAMCLRIAAGDPRLAAPGFTNGVAVASGVGSSEAVAQARRLFYETSGSPEYAGQQFPSSAFSSNSTAVVSSDARVAFSGRHEGIALYLARLLRPIWKLNVSKADAKDPSQQVSNVPEATLVSVQLELSRLSAFIENGHAALFGGARRGQQDQGALGAEQASLQALQSLLTQAVEAISFVLLLIDYRFSDIIAACTPEVNAAFKSLTYRDFLVTIKGRDLARDIVRTLINHQIGRSLSVDAISEILQQRCGSFCSSDDVLLYKAVEALNHAQESTLDQEQWTYAQESLRLLSKAAKHVSVEQLQNTCSTYIQILMPENAINLALACAAAWDPSDAALAFYQSGRPQNDSRQSAFDARQRCYECAKRALTAVDDLLNEAVSSPHGRRLMPEEAVSLRDTARSAAFGSTDELFHYVIYDWLLERQMTEQLIDMRTPFLEAYLASDGGSFEKLDLLWRYYVQAGRRYEASRTLAKMAESTNFDVPVARRCELLSAAVANAKASPSEFGRDAAVFEFVTDVEEKLDVAKVQIDVEAAVRDLSADRISDERRRDVLHALQSRLLSITELYSEVAEPFGLLESTLCIFAVADHRDQELIRDTWEEIIDTAHRGRDPISGAEAVAGKTTELARRFYPSEIAFSLPMVVNMLESYALRYSQERRNWVPDALRQGGVPWQAIWETLDEIFTAKLPPWHVNESLVFLASDILTVIEAWMREAFNNRATLDAGDVPVASISDAIDRWAAKKKLKDRDGTRRRSYHGQQRLLACLHPADDESGPSEMPRTPFARSPAFSFAQSPERHVATEPGEQQGYEHTSVDAETAASLARKRQRLLSHPNWSGIPGAAALEPSPSLPRRDHVERSRRKPSLRSTQTLEDGIPSSPPPAVSSVTSSSGGPSSDRCSDATTIPLEGVEPVTPRKWGSVSAWRPISPAQKQQTPLPDIDPEPDSEIEDWPSSGEGVRPSVVDPEHVVAHPAVEASPASPPPQILAPPSTEPHDEPPYEPLDLPDMTEYLVAGAALIGITPPKVVLCAEGYYVWDRRPAQPEQAVGKDVQGDEGPSPDKDVAGSPESCFQHGGLSLTDVARASRSETPGDESVPESLPFEAIGSPVDEGRPVARAGSAGTPFSWSDSEDPQADDDEVEDTEEVVPAAAASPEHVAQSSQPKAHNPFDVDAGQQLTMIFDDEADW